MSSLITVGRFHFVISQIQYVQEVSTDRLRVYLIGGESVDVYTSRDESASFVENLDEALHYIPEPYELNQ